MPPRQSLKQFLSTARAALTAPGPRRTAPLTFVVGNESADLDSLCSAVVCAYIRSLSPPGTLHIPLSNLPRADLALRTEMTAVLRRAGLTPSDLLTLSELPADLSPDEARWFLVDHNALTGELRRFQDQVVGVIDHHVDEGMARDVVPRVIEPCGSCVSLVVDECRGAWDALPSAGEEDERLAMLALAPLLIDTIGLRDEAKVKQKDVHAAEYLEAKIAGGFDRMAYFEEVAAVMEDISELGFRDIFRKDYKEWTEAGLTLGISCVVRNFDFLLDKAGGDAAVVVAHLADWAEERKLDVACVMTVSRPGGEFQRHLLLWGITERGLRCVETFPRIAGEKLGLEQWRDGVLDDGRRRMAWRQRDWTSSRKQVAPLLREALINH